MHKFFVFIQMILYFLSYTQFVLSFHFHCLVFIASFIVLVSIIARNLNFDCFIVYFNIIDPNFQIFTLSYLFNLLKSLSFNLFSWNYHFLFTIFFNANFQIKFITNSLFFKMLRFDLNFIFNLSLFNPNFQKNLNF